MGEEHGGHWLGRRVRLLRPAWSQGADPGGLEALLSTSASTQREIRHLWRLKQRSDMISF